MDDTIRAALAEHLLAMGDDELILGHRDSEWCGHAPILEEDIAFANIALDEQGHAAIWYGLCAELVGEDQETYPDKLAFLRPAEEFRNAPLVELPKGDWAFSMLRQYLLDVAESTRLEPLSASQYAPLAGAAARVRREEFYHLRHTQAWVRRMGLGTHESHRRIQAALVDLWPYATRLFDPLPGDGALTASSIIPNWDAWKSTWEKQIGDFLVEAGLTIPARIEPIEFSRTHHSEHLTTLVTDMQVVARLQPDARW